MAGGSVSSLARLGAVLGAFIIVVAARAEGPGGAGGDPIANTARSIPATPPDTIIDHPPSPIERLRPEMPGPGVLPSRSASTGRSGWKSGGGYWAGLLSLLGVLALIWVISAAAKRFVLPRTRFGRRPLDVIGRTYISGKQSVALVRAGRRLLVVGVTAGQITPLASIEDPEEVAELAGQAESEKPESIQSRFARDIAAHARRFQEQELQDQEAPVGRAEFSVRAREQVRSALARVRRLGRGPTAGDQTDSDPAARRWFGMPRSSA